MEETLVEEDCAHQQTNLNCLSVVSSRQFPLSLFYGYGRENIRAENCFPTGI